MPSYLEIQLSRFNDLFSKQHISEYYRKNYSEGLTIRDIADLQELNFTTKKQLQANNTLQFVPKQYQSSIVEYHSTSSTTGKPLIAAYTREDIEIWSELNSRIYEAGGMLKGDKIQIAFNYGLFTGAFGFHYAAMNLELGIIPISSGNTIRQINTIYEQRPKGINLTPSYLFHLTEIMEMEGYNLSKCPLEIAFCGAEPITEEFRRNIENKINIKVLNNYGLTEMMGPGVSFECKFQDGMHINEDYFISEIIDTDTLKPVKDGEYGELVLTSLRPGMPLLRYRTGDICKYIIGNCKCGRQSRRISKIKNRIDDMLIINGVNIYPSAIENTLYKCIQNFNGQFLVEIKEETNIQKPKISIEIKSDLIGKTAEESISRTLKDTIGIHFQVKLVKEKSLPRYEGKSKRIIKN